MTIRNKLSVLLTPAFLVSAFGQAAALSSPDISSASIPPGAATAPIRQPWDIINLFNAILVWVATAFWILAVIFIFYAAFLYLTAGGDPERTRKAHKQLLWAVIAIAVALMAYGMPLLIRNILSAGCINIGFFAIC